ncbi:MAG: hypothetical protein ACRD0M_07075, partial [Acidimicrobiales bacterium]
QRVGLITARAAMSPVGDLTARLGVQVAADELLFFPNLPVRVDDVKVRAGDPLSGPVMTVTNSQLAITGALSFDDAKLVRQGAAVAIQDRELGTRATGAVTEVAGTPGTNGVEPQRFYLGVTPTGTPGALVGATVTLTITVQSTEGDVLAVPVSALSVAADGTSRVEVQAADSTTRFVTVRPGLVAKGLVAVTPLLGNLHPGELVVVGTGPGGTALPGSTSTIRSTSTTKGENRVP